MNIIGNHLYFTTSGDNHDDSWYVGHVSSVDLATGETQIWNALCSNLRYLLNKNDCKVDDNNGAVRVRLLCLRWCFCFSSLLRLHPPSFSL